MNAGRPRKDIPDTLKAKLIRLIANGLTVERAALSTGIKRTTWYELREHDEDFRSQWDEAAKNAIPFAVRVNEIWPEVALREIQKGKLEWFKWVIGNFRLGLVDPEAVNKHEHEAVKVALKRQATMGGEKAQITRLQPAGTEAGNKVSELA